MNAFRKWCGVSGILFLAGCVSVGPSRKKIPRFETPLPGPVVIQVLDERPAEQKGEEGFAEWIYFARSVEQQAQQIGQLLGNGLNAMGATAGSQLASPEVPWGPEITYGIRIRLWEGYARWPVQPNPNRSQVPVEGYCQVGVELWREGRRIKQFRITGRPPDFEVPVNIIRRENVRRIVGDALEHQYQTAVTEMLDLLMPRLAMEWESFREWSISPSVPARFSGNRR
jgi:hypothetical protein